MNYSQSKRAIFTMTVLSLALIEANRAVGFDGNYAGAGTAMLGASDAKALAAGEELALDVLGTSTLEAGGAIVAGALVEVGANGKFVTKAAGIAVARALSATTATGELFEALLLPANT